MKSVNTKDILTYSVFSGTLSELVENIYREIQTSEKKRYLACLNPHSYVVSKNNKYFSKSLKTADWLVPDGTGILLASKILRRPLYNRVTGFDVFDELHHHFEKAGGVKVFFLGSSKENLKEMKHKMEQQFSNVCVAGVYSPPFKNSFTAEETRDMIMQVNSSKAQILWVGMTAPKQEEWILQNIDFLDVKFIAAVGAVFDFYTGNVKRPSKFFCDLGLEWLPRLIREPRRLWRRMFVSAPIFIIDVLKQRIGKSDLLK